jgi:hypothetical protein
MYGALAIRRWLHIRRLKPNRPRLSFAEFIEHLSRVIIRAVAGGNQTQTGQETIVAIKPLRDGGYRVLYPDAEEREAEQYLLALKDILHPSAPGGYSIMTQRLDPGEHTLRKLVTVSTHEKFIKESIVLDVPPLFADAENGLSCYLQAFESVFGKVTVMEADSHGKNVARRRQSKPIALARFYRIWR